MNTGDIENLFYQSVIAGFTLQSSAMWLRRELKINLAEANSPFRGDALVGELRLQRVHLAVQAGHRGLRLQQLLFQPLVLLSGHKRQRRRFWNNGHIHPVLPLTTVSSLIFLFNAGLSSFTVMLLYFSSI